MTIAVLSAIPYTTFPEIDLGPVTLRTFGVMLALGVLLGTTVAARWGERFGVASDEMVGLATRMVIAGVIGARVTWVLTHLSEIDSPVDVFAVWEGGLQFSGGFIAAVAVGIPTFLRWSPYTRWRVLDGCALGLAIGLAVGRIGCYSVGEHFGGRTSFFLGTRYDGGNTREPVEGGVGSVIHNTALYEFLQVGVLVGVLWWLLYRRRARPVTTIAVFVLWYAVGRFVTDFFRAYDETNVGLTGAQWMALAMVPIGFWLLLRVRPSVTAAAPPDEEHTDEEHTHEEHTHEEHTEDQEGPATPGRRPT